MAVTGFIYDERYLAHDPGSYHPERPDRLKAIVKRLTFSGLLDGLKRIEPYEAPLEWIETLHDRDYIESFQAACEKGWRIFQSPDNGICRESYQIARLAVGGVLAGCDAMMTGEVNNCFCAVRPPGHHAEHARAMGFCFFNNIALGARYLQKKYGQGRVAIVDWDVHHGNGTQHLFEADPTVMYISLHEDPSMCYPGTGHKNEKGKGAGLGYTLNFPFPPRSGNQEYLAVMEEDVLPALETFAPDCLMISAGFDAHANDPLAHMRLDESAYARMGRMLADLASRHCQGRIVTVLEGGYNLEALADCVEEHIQILSEMTESKP